MDQELLNRLKETELGLLKAFIKCCEKLEIKYYLLGGTMLGAVRHRGFIPWDDDIDVAMLRGDYELFLAEGQQYLPEYYFLQSLHSEQDVLFDFAKIRDSRTTFIETSVKNANINHGVFLDIFPLDYYPDDPKEQKRFDRKNRLLGLRIRLEYTFAKGRQGTRLYTRHGEKLYETLMTREERLRSEDMGHYFRVAADNRDLNYDKYFFKGQVQTMAEEAYTSHNTNRLDVEGTVKKLLTTDYVREALAEDRSK